MYFQNSIPEQIKCQICQKDGVIICIEAEHRDDSVYMVPDGWFQQFGGDYCGGRWVIFYCSQDCADCAVCKNDF